MAVSDENFMHYYQKMLFESRNNEQYTLCSAKRKCLSQLYLSSIKRLVMYLYMFQYLQYKVTLKLGSFKHLDSSNMLG